MARKNTMSKRLKRIKGNFMSFCRERKGYVLSIALLLGVGLVSLLVFKNGTDGGEAPTHEASQIDMHVIPTQEVLDVSANKDQNLSQAVDEALKTQTLAPIPTLMPDFTQAPEKKSNAGEKLVSPVSGEVIWGYAVDSLIFSRTLSQWMTHCGVDIASPKGSEVRALENGHIENVYTDDLLGVSVVLVHENGMMSVYANLKEEPPVKEGQLIKKRDVIGYVGDTAISECGDESHLHLELYKGDLPVDPSDYIRFDKGSIE